jgi:hypothetical protein
MSDWALDLFLVEAARHSERERANLHGLGAIRGNAGPWGYAAGARPSAGRAEHDRCAHCGDSEEKQRNEHAALSRSALRLCDQRLEREAWPRCT